jgi:hypothetical protein
MANNERAFDDVVQPCPLQKKETSPVHWIEIELVGEDDSPIPFQPYEIRLPNGEIVDGYLDRSGLARLTDLPDGGICRLRFPLLDKDAWEVITAVSS